MCHDFLPHIHVLLPPGETIKQVPSCVVVSLDFLLDYSNHQLAWDQLSLFDDWIYLSSQLRASFDLFPQKISSGEMDEIVLFD